MNKIAIFFCGTAVGAAVGALIANHLVKKYYQKLAEDEVSEVREWAKQLHDLSKTLTSNTSKDEKGKNEVEEEPETSDVTIFTPYHKMYRASIKPDPEDIVKQELEESGPDPAEEEFPTEEDEILEENEEEEDFEVVEKPTGDRIYPISEQDFANAFSTDRDTLTWYRGDSTLADSQEEMIHDVEGTLGKEVADFLLNMDIDDPTDVVYVRNDRIDMDLEVVIDDRSYSDYILGLSYEVVGSSDIDKKLNKSKKFGRRKMREDDE